MSRDLCRIFRHFLDDDETYGERVNILYKVVGTDFEKLLAANDPLYITKPSNTPGFENNTIMELKSNDKDPREGKIEIAFTNPLTRKPDKSEVLFKFSFIKPQIREKESDQRSELMKHLKRNTGISFVRDGREVDFGNFNYFTAYDTTERWWGCEIRFDPLLDEIFGVTIDKQNVRNMGPLSPEIIRDTEITKEDIEYIPNLKLRLEITKRFTDFRKKYMSLRRQQAEGTRAGTKRSPSIADRIFKKRKVLTRSKAEGQTKSEDQINQEHKIKAKKIEELTGKTYTAEQLRDLIEANKKLEVDIDFEGWDGSQFFATEIIGKTATVKINVNHKFYNKLYVSLAKELDKTNVEIVDFMLMSWARVEDELSVTNVKLDDFVKIKEKWGQILTELLDEQEQLLN
jgi:hypothetical protein